MDDKKLSIIIPVYNAEEYLEKCLDNLLAQSYENIEVIVVNDASKGNCDEIVAKYSSKDSRISCVKHEKNKGLFQARITGASHASGDYIAFLDSDDYTSIDYYRTLMANAEQNDSDMVIGNTVLEYDNGKQILYNLFDFGFEELNGDEGIREYFRQEGLIFSWHTIWNKIYKKSIWDKAVIHYKKQNKHLVMTEDFAFSTVLFYYANKITRTANDAIFYCKHEITSTSVHDITLKKAEKNMEDMITSFQFVEDFLKEVNIYEKYKTNFENWRILYCNQQKSYLEIASLKKEEKNIALEKLKSFCSSNKVIENAGFFGSIVTPWNSGLEKIKKAICDENIKVVSFDIFDTLVVRPFFVPADLFVLLNNTFRNVVGIKTGIDFSKMRTTSEQIARNRRYTIESEKPEITLDEIYKVMAEIYHIQENVLEIMKQKEIEYEIRFCMVRNTGYELYELCKAKGKKVICTSDMYLPKDVIQKILQKNNYIGVEEIYLSCETRTTKSTGNLFKEVLNKENLEANQLLHIGDNNSSDYEMPLKIGIEAKHLPRTVDVFCDENKTNGLSSVFIKNLPDWQDNRAAMQFVGIRCMLAVVANRYFDNPYRSFEKSSDFNADPFLIGYYTLGMYLFGITKWLVDDVSRKNYDSLVFMARDGFLPLKAYQIMKKYNKNLPKEKYLYVSRKALIPVTILSETDLYKLSEVININNHTPQDIVKYLKESLTVTDESLKIVCTKNNIQTDKNFEDIAQFNSFMSLVAEHFFDKGKHDQRLKKLTNYFNNFYEGKTCTFDIGYSGRPEMFLTQLCQKPIDTYFININNDEAMRYSHIGGFELNTFFDYKPSVTGNVNEFIISELAPSCIGYKIEKDKVAPIFEEYKEVYAQANIIEKMQNASLKFVKDMLDIFGDDIQELYYQKYYVSLPLAMYIHSASPVDQDILRGIIFEDNVRLKENVNAVDLWRKTLSESNQHHIKELSEFMVLVPQNVVENHSKPIRAMYYILFDRITLKEKAKEKLKKHRWLTKVSRFGYSTLRSIKNAVYGFMRKLKQN